MTCKVDNYDRARPFVDMLGNFVGIEIDGFRINVNEHGNSSDS